MVGIELQRWGPWGLCDPGHALLLLQLIHPAPLHPWLQHGAGRAQGSPPLLAMRWRAKAQSLPCWLLVGTTIPQGLPTKCISIDSAINAQIPGSQAKKEQLQQPAMCSS